MPVHSASQLALAVVEVQRPYIFESDDSIESSDGFFKCRGCSKIVPGGETVAGVEAHADTTLIIYLLDYYCKMFKLETDAASLPRGIFDDRGYPAREIERAIDGLRDRTKTLINRTPVQMIARMKIEKCQSQLLAPLHLIAKRSARFLERIALGVSEIYQVAVVGENSLGSKRSEFAVTPELGYYLTGVRLRFPPALILQEQSKCRRADCLCVFGGSVNSPTGAHMRSDIFHSHRPVAESPA